MFGLGGDDRYGLDGGRTGSDDAHAPAGEVDALMGPPAGVVRVSQETLAALEIREIRRRQASGRHDQEGCRCRLAGVRGYQPPVFVEDRACHAGIEGDVPTQVEPLGDMVGVAKDLRLTGVALCPFPLLLQFVGETVGVLHALDIAARAGVAIPVPRAANVVASLEDAGAEACAAQSVQHVEAGESGAHDDHIGV